MYSAAGYSSDEDDFDDYLFGDYCDENGEQDIIPAERNLERDLYRACISDRVEEVREILDTGFDVNAVLEDGWTALLVSASVGSKECIKELVKRGADVNIDRDGHTALMALCSCLTQYASHEDVFECMKLFLEKGADPTRINRSRVNALMYAAANGNCLVVKELLKFCDKNAEDNQGWNALFWAVSGNQPDMVQLLFEDGLKCDIFDIRGDTPYHYALKFEYQDVIKLLPCVGPELYQQVYVLVYDNYANFFERGSTDFIDNICAMLYGMGCERAIDRFLDAKINLSEFLCCSGISLTNIGITAPYVQRKILKGLHKLHLQRFKVQSVPVIKKNDKISTSDLGLVLVSAARHFIVMRASLRYIYENARKEDLKNFKHQLSTIKHYSRNLSSSLGIISSRVQQWDQFTGVDLITEESCKKLKKNSNWLCTVGIVSLFIIAIKLKFY